MRLQNKMLTVEAHDSDLAEILRRIAADSGMTIDGLGSGEGAVKSSRIFGNYGPGNPRTVMTRLLTGSGYNFVMAGETREGTPQKLLLTAQTGSTTVPSSPAAASSGPPAARSASPAASPNSAPPQPETEPEQGQGQEQDQPSEPESENPKPAPNPPPVEEEGPENSPQPQQEQQQRMQQLLERLQQMHQQQGQGGNPQ